MTNPPTSRLLDAALRPHANDGDQVARDRLRVALVDIRARADVIARRIEVDLPEFTDHTGDHLDALWPLVDLVADRALELSPLEVFVLGAAIAVHDLGLPIAAYPGGRDVLRSLPRWRDTKAMRRRTQGLRAEEAEIDMGVDREVLRSLHADRAALLPVEPWTDEKGDKQFLVQDQDLREDLGHMIGLIAASHGWPASELRARLPEGDVRPARFPASWTLRPILLACLLACFLRVADAAQIDGTRAPRWARVHRHLGTVASAHWDFQERLAQPSLVRDHLRFASLRPFEAEQALAWWTCFDALTVIDHELHEVDRVLTDSGLPRLAARGVLDVDTPARLAEHVRPDGWDPVEVRVRVTDVARLVQNLGGEALYGDHSKAPIRELIANARDAVRARIALTGDTSGLIRVSAWTTAEHDVAYLEVEDNGVGMDSRTITDTLLDFGQGLWDSPGLIEVHSGLAETDFEPIGKFGIGFFSVFMWAEKVLVLSRPFRQGEDATRLLVLDGGPGARPVLRKPHPADNRKDGGTVVRLEMREKPLGRSRQATERALERAQQRGDRLPEPTGRSSSIGGLVGQVAPALDVDLEVLHAGECELACSANDWLTIDGNELLRRIARSEENYEPISTALMPVVESDGVVVGRSALVPRPYRSNPCGVASIGGLAADTLPQPIAGIWLAIPSTAARDNSKPLATADAVRDWATRQAEYWSARLDAEDQLELAMRVIWLGGDPGPLATFRTADGPIRYQDFGTWACNRATITVVHFLARTDFPESSAIPKDTVLEPHQGFLENPFKWFDRHGALMMVYWMGDRIAEAWGVELGDLRGEKAELELTYGDSYPKHGAVKFFRPQT